MARNHQDAVDVPDYDDQSNEFAATQAAAASNRSADNPSSGSSSGRGRSSRSKQAKDQKHTEGADEVDEKQRDPFTTTLRRDLRERLNGMVSHAQQVGKPDNIASNSDYVNLALANQLARDEKKLNDGKPFPAPAITRTGRPPKR